MDSFRVSWFMGFKPLMDANEHEILISHKNGPVWGNWADRQKGAKRG
jgi:hypothetical protein